MSVLVPSAPTGACSEPRQPGHPSSQGATTTSGGWREALLAALLLTLWSLAERGFSGARWSDVPIIKSFVDPRLYRQDPFIWTLHNDTPAAYPYQLLAAAVRGVPWLSFEQVLFLVYLPFTVAALALLYRIGLELTGSRASTMLFLLLYVVGFRLVTFGSAVLHSAETTPQILALPFQLGAFYVFMQGRLPAAGLLMGLGMNLHVPSTVYLAGALVVCGLLSFRRLNPRSGLVAIALLLLAGAPTVVGLLRQHNFELPLWALNLARAELATDTSFTVNLNGRVLVGYNLLGLGLAALAWWKAPAGAGRRAVLCFCIAVGLMCLGALLFFDLSLRTPLSTLVARLQLPRSAWLLNVFGLLYLAHLLSVGWRGGSVPRPLALLVVAAMLAAPADFSPLDPLLFAAEALLLAVLLVPRDVLRSLGWWAPWGLALVGAAAGVARLRTRELDFQISMHTALIFAGLAAAWGLSRLLRRRGWSEARAVVPAVLLGLSVATAVTRTDEWLEAWAHKGGLKSAAEFQEWARTQTPTDSIFLLLPSEPNNHDFYERAERGIFLVRDRANQVVYFPEHSVEFERRVRALGVAQPLRYREALDPAYRRLTEERVRDLAREFGVTHFVPAWPGAFSFPIVYQSGAWTVYQVSAGS
jgi:hypothetical protein